MDAFGLLTHNILAIPQVKNKVYNDKTGVEASEASSEWQNLFREMPHPNY